MDIFKRLFGKVTVADFEAIAQDTSSSGHERARRIAEAFNRARDPSAYLKFRDKQMDGMERILQWVPQVDGADKQMWHANEKHRREVRELELKGPDELLKNESRLLHDAKELVEMLKETLKVMQGAVDTVRDLKETFTVLAEAEKQMPQFPVSERENVAAQLKILSEHEDNIMKRATSLPKGNSFHADIALVTARMTKRNANLPSATDDEIARKNARNERARRQREAFNAEQADKRKIKLNEYLDTGLVTGAAIKAPKTARFTRKPKTVSAP